MIRIQINCDNNDPFPDLLNSATGRLILVASVVPAGRLLDQKNGACIFLASAVGSFVDGIELPVDSG